MTAAVDRSFQERNGAARARLARILDRLRPPDLELIVDGWTVGTNLAHLAFWDRFTLVRWEEAAASGREVPLGLGPPLFDLVNEALAPEWARLDLDAVRALTLDAATRLDASIAALPDERVAAAIAAGMRRNVDRSMHRAVHLDPIEAALGWVADVTGPPRAASHPARLSCGHVSQHHHPARPGACRDRRGDRGGRPPVRAQGQRRLVTHGRHPGRVRGGRRGRHRGHDPAAGLAARPATAATHGAAAPPTRCAGTDGRREGAQ